MTPVRRKTASTKFGRVNIVVDRVGCRVETTACDDLRTQESGTRNADARCSGGSNQYM